MLASPRTASRLALFRPGGLVRLFCASGMSDRLRVGLSYLAVARETGCRIHFAWPVNQACPGHFLSVFRPISDMDFPAEHDAPPDIHDCLQAFDPRLKFIYGPLVAADPVKRRAERITDELGDYVAVHVRRTDHWRKDSDALDISFFDFIDKSGRDRIFLASDEYSTQKKFMDRYGSRIVCSPITPSSNLRQTTLEQAVVDMSVCITASDFMGSWYSGFSRLISGRRKHMHGIPL